MSYISSVLTLQGRSRRNARRQLALIRDDRAQAAEAAWLLEQAAEGSPRRRGEQTAPVPAERFASRPPVTIVEGPA